MFVDNEIDRLAKGLAREATRHLHKRELTDLINDLGDFLDKRFKLPYLQRSGPTPKQLTKLRNELYTYVKEHYFLFNEAAFTHINSESHHAGFYWASQEVGFEKEGGEDLSDMGVDFEGFKERLLHLTYIRYGVGRGSTIVDEVYQRLVLSDHVLYRMVERGECDRDPLAYLNERIKFWLSWINAFSWMQIPDGFIPLERGGICLKSYMIAHNAEDPNWSAHDRRRYKVSRAGLQWAHLNTPDLTQVLDSQGNKTWIDYRMTTYLDDSILRMERLWAKQAMVDFYNKWQSGFDELFHLNVELDLKAATVAFLTDEFSDFRVALKRFVQQPRFVDACKPYGVR